MSRQTGKTRRIDHYGERLRKRRDRLSPGMLTVADYIDGHRHAVLSKSALEIGFATGTSDATVIRTLQALGFSGLVDLKDTLEAYLGQTDSPIEKMATTTDELKGNSDAAIDFVVENQRAALETLTSANNRAALAIATQLLTKSAGIGVFGIGASGIIADYAARLFARSGFRSYALNNTGIALAEQMLAIEQGHALLMLLHGRPHREALTAINEAKRLDVPVILVLSQSESVLRQHASACLVMPRTKSEQVALHAPSLVAVETIALALAATAEERTLKTLNRLVDLRSAIRPDKR
ncbi:MurR/RpiR family transcriptional regulator [Rhizobium sp.]|jgi:DNA-binding MurR/RpiR family transcriptional regulator|uniref:MurR/RpiR family transcriptional regulator n=1 Tax=Rhizobium sp. TaxID=391 RepID=UPI000E872875|nr:MurR/RpiR family transcriptional regulator [Rhizobium sp.]